jgi:periplasmic copper chaperone A
MKRRTVLTLLLSPAAAQAHSFKHGNIAIGHAWALPSQQTDAQVFMPLVNNGEEPDSLVAARTPAATLVELRPYNRYDELPMKEFVLDPHKPFPMRPTARHLRLVGLTKPLLKGDVFSLVLDFLNAGEIEIEIRVADSAGE